LLQRARRRVYRLLREATLSNVSPQLYQAFPRDLHGIGVSEQIVIAVANQFTICILLEYAMIGFATKDATVIKCAFL
jgi:hypothetical protein